MFHAISAGLARLARRINARLATAFEYAAWHGWQVPRSPAGPTSSVTPGSASSPPSAPPRILTPQDSRSWAQDALAATHPRPRHN